MSDWESERRSLFQLLEEHHPAPVPVPACLYHYTTAAGLLGILKRDKNEIWASAIGFSNDASEGRYTTRVGLEVLRSHPISEQSTEPCRRVLGFLHLLFSFPGRDWEDGYVASFCKKDNVLSQWRAYGGAASFSIGFRALSADNLDCMGSSGMRLLKVVYDDSDQKDPLRRALDAAHRLLTLDPLPEQNVDRVQRLLDFYVAEWACSVKHKAFEEEQEWRITVFPSFGGLKSPGYGVHRSIPRPAGHLEFRERRGRLLPYLSIKPKAGKFDIQSITVGPSKTQSLDARAVDLLKDKLGLGEVEVRYSDIPLQS